MRDEELRSLVRAALARHAGPPAGALADRPPDAVMRLHPSHRLLVVPAGGDADGPCLIEPAVVCNHCGYCQSYGH